MRKRSRNILVGVILAGVILVALILALPLGGTSSGVKGGHGDYCVDYCTQTQDCWGLECSDENVGCLRDNNWDEVTGGTLTVGEGHTLTFTSSESVANFLPTSGPAAALADEHTNPTVTESGVLGGQVTTLKLNVLFSDEGVGRVEPVCTGLRNTCILRGPFSGMKIENFIELAEKALGGDTSELVRGATLQDVSDTAMLANENFIDCASSNDFVGDCELASGVYILDD